MRISLFIFVFICWQSTLGYEEGKLIYGSCEMKNHELFYANDNIYLVSSPFTYLKGASVKGKKLFDREGYSQIITMTYDQVKSMLYYVEAEYPKRINAYNISNATLSHFDQDVEKFREIAIDLVTGNIYFISHAKDIGFCDFSLRKCVKLVENSNDRQTKYRNLLLHTEGLMFWIESRESDLGALWMAHTDGSYMQKIPGLDHVSSIALNSTGSLLYFTTETELVQLNLKTMQHKQALSLEESILFYFDCHLFAVQKYRHNYGIYNSMFERVADGEWRGDANPLLSAKPGYESYSNNNKNACVELGCSGLCVLVSNKNLDTKVKCVEEESLFFWIMLAIGVLLIAILLVVGYKCGLLKKLRSCFQRQTEAQTKPLSISYTKSYNQK